MLHRFFCSGNGFTTWHRNCCMGTSLSLMLCGFSHCVHEQSDALSGVPLIGHAWRSPVIVSTQQYCHTLFLCFCCCCCCQWDAKSCDHFYIRSFTLCVIPLNWLCFQGNEDEDVHSFTANLPTLPWEFGKAVCKSGSTNWQQRVALVWNAHTTVVYA